MFCIILILCFFELNLVSTYNIKMDDKKYGEKVWPD
jgi:hypothetical protein